MKLRRLTFLVGILFALATASAQKAAPTPKTEKPFAELRGVWITNVDSDVLTSREKIAEGMDYLRSIGINIVYPVVYNRAMTLYPSEVMEREFGIKIDPRYEGRDVLQEILFEAHRNGIEVVPWFEYGFSSSYNQGGGFILEQRPEWAAIDQEGRLANKNGFEWLNAFDPAVQKYMSDLLMEVVEKYDVDGVQGDDRLPALPTLAGYDAATVARYKKETGKDAPADIKEPDWVKWRANILTAFLADLQKRIKVKDPNLMVSLSPSPYDWGLQEYLQNSKGWMEAGLPDTLHPQLYRREKKDYRSIADATAAQFPSPANKKVYPGMLTNLGKDYLISKSVLLDEIAYNRKLGFQGEVFFFYEGLRKNNNELGTALRKGPYRRDALLPYRNGYAWREMAVVFSPEESGAEGAWSRSADGQTFTLPGGSDGRFIYTLNSPVWVKNHIYVKVSNPSEEGVPRVYTFVSRLAVAAVTCDPKSTPHIGEWYYLGSWVVSPEKTDKLILRRGDGSTDGSLVADQVMLMVDRTKPK